MTVRAGQPRSRREARREDLAALSLFADLDEGDQSKLAALGELQEFAEGDEIFREGQDADVVFALVSGRVSLCTRPPGRAEFCFLSVAQGELLGWSGLLPAWRRVATVRALERCVLLHLPGEPLRQLCEEDHDIGYRIMRAAFREVAGRLHDTRIQLMDIYGKED